jgi:hypothetical protein
MKLFTIPVTKGRELVGYNKMDFIDQPNAFIGSKTVPFQLSSVTEEMAKEWGFESAKSLRISILEILLNDKMYSIVPNNILLILVKTEEK